MISYRRTNKRESGRADFLDCAKKTRAIFLEAHKETPILAAVLRVIVNTSSQMAAIASLAQLARARDL